MSAHPQKVWTVETYLAFERTSEERHEYFAGEIFAMAGASRIHNLVVMNTSASLHAQLRQKSCTVYPSDMRLKISVTGLYTYPDISVVCGQPQLEDSHQDTLLNPMLLIEVLSPSSENYDRGKKFQHYRTLDSLQEYLLISQDSPRIEHYRRQEKDQWLLSETTRLEDSIALPSIGCQLLLADVYEKVTFEDV